MTATTATGTSAASTTTSTKPPGRCEPPSPEEEYEVAVAERLDAWVPGCGGAERPFRTRSGRRLLYCFNPGQSRHAYLDCDTDIILTDAEARLALGEV